MKIQKGGKIKILFCDYVNGNEQEEEKIEQNRKRKISFQPIYQKKQYRGNLHAITVKFDWSQQQEKK